MVIYYGTASVSIAFTGSALPGPFMGRATVSTAFTSTVAAGKITAMAAATGRVQFDAYIGEAFALYEGPYVKYLQKIAPPWLLSDRGKRWLQAHGDGLDLVSDLIRLAVQARIIAVAPEDALVYIGIDRGMPRYPTETTEDYRTRLIGAWDYWQWGGTKKGVQDVLALLGYAVEITELYTLDPLRWSEFAITVAPIIGGFRKRLWADGGLWGDGGLWAQGWAPVPDELEALESLVAGMKAAHTKMTKLEWFSEPTYNTWGDGGLWGDGGSWPDRTEVVYA